MYLNFFVCFFELRIRIYVTFDYFRSETFTEITFRGKPISRCFAGINFHGQRENSKKKNGHLIHFVEINFRGKPSFAGINFCRKKENNKKKTVI